MQAVLSPEKLQIQCPSCKTMLMVDAIVRGRLIACPKCGHECLLSDGSLGKDVDQQMFGELVDQEYAASQAAEAVAVDEAPAKRGSTGWIGQNLGVIVVVTTIAIGLLVAGVMVATAI